MDDILTQLGLVVSSWSELGRLAGLIALVNLLTNLTKLRWVQDKLCGLPRMSPERLKAIMPWFAVGLGAWGGFLTALQQGRPIPQALFTGMFIGLAAIGTHEVAKKKAPKDDAAAEPAPGKNGVNLVLIFICVLSIALPGCRWFAGPDGPVAKLIDCSRASATEMKNFDRDLRPFVMGQAKPDWDLIKGKAAGVGATIGGCVLALLVQEYLATNKGAAEGTWAANDALEKFRTTVAGGATFRTVQGDL